MSQNTFSRYELKYILTTEQYKTLTSLIFDYMRQDPHGNSTIHNIYFDTPDKLLIRRSLDSTCYKEKLRVRSYGMAQPESMVYIELKKKFKGVVYKRRIKLTEAAASNYMLYGTPLHTQSQISREIDYFIKLYHNLEPAIFLSYQREAFFGKADKDFRMTFDKNILARDNNLTLTTNAYGQAVLPQGRVLLEVKTAFGLPRWLLDFFGANAIYKTSFSKYGTAYSNLLLPKFLGGNRNVA